MGIRISQLPETKTIDVKEDLIPIVQEGITKKILLDYVKHPDQNSVFNNVKGLSAFWNSVYTTYNSNSSTYAIRNDIYNNFLRLSGGTINGNLFILSSLQISKETITGDLHVLSSLQVGSGDSVLFLSGNKVGINTEIPNVELTVSGQISSNDIIFDSKGNSSQWNSTYSIYSLNSSAYLPLSGGTITNDLLILSSLEVGSGDNVGLYLSIDNKVGINTDDANVELTVNGQISSNSIIYDRSGNSVLWNSVYTAFNSSSSGFLSLSGGTITGKTIFHDDVTIYGNLSASGNSYFSNTIYSTTSALSVINIGNTGPALYVGNNGTGDIASFYDLDQNVEILHVGGNNGSFPNVGVKTSSPNKDLTVKGEISASGKIFAQTLDVAAPLVLNYDYSLGPNVFTRYDSALQLRPNGNIHNRTGIEFTKWNNELLWRIVTDPVAASDGSLAIGPLSGSNLISQPATIRLNQNNNHAAEGNWYINGNVGIGTPTPNAPLQFPSTVATRKIALYDQYNNNNQFYGFGIESNNLIYSVDSTSSNHTFFCGLNSSTRKELFSVKGSGGINVTDGNINLSNTYGIYWSANTDGASVRFESINNGEGQSRLILETYDDADEPIIIRQQGLDRLYIGTNGNVGIGTSTPNQKLSVSGNITATGNITANTLQASVKNFVIKHPIDDSKSLQYSSIESPYIGIRLTGEDKVINGECIVKLPAYIKGLIHKEDVHILLTNYKHSNIIFVDDIDIENNTFTVKSENCIADKEYKFFWSLTGVRKDVPNLQVEI